MTAAVDDHGGCSSSEETSLPFLMACSLRFPWRTNPTLQLLSTPWEYFVTIDQSALWQKHIAWAKPKGSDLKAYISSQYSSRMVLLSLLLATEMSVFFNSSPEIIDLRRCLNIWDNNTIGNDLESTTRVGGILPFWVGFVLLLNICVTISGILATFSTWNVVSAISDANAHCLLRSSLGQYVATLSPRLVVTSLYLFLLWFLLFVVELIFGGNNTKTFRWELLHELFAKHWHLVLLWACFLVAVTALFFSIVVPLSALGRLVVHTGAMGEQPVLSESLQVELLPRGLHAGLVIRAHHSQMQKKAVTRQYQAQSRKRPWRTRENVVTDQESNQLPSWQNGNNNDSTHVPSGIENDGYNNENAYQQFVCNGSENETTTSVKFTRSTTKAMVPSTRMSVSTASSGNSDIVDGNTTMTESQDITNRTSKHGTNGTAKEFPRLNEVFINTDRKQTNISNFLDQEMNFKPGHSRILTAETLMSPNLPPAAILNLSMTTKDFQEVIDNALDTSSLCAHSLIETMGSERHFQMRTENVDNEDFNSMIGNDSAPMRVTLRQDVENREKDQHVCDTNNLATRRGSSHKSGIPLSPYSTSHQDLITRHHRRVSSSRFLLEEWAQENRVRDLYGAAPPADLPHEIAWMLGNGIECHSDDEYRKASEQASLIYSGNVNRSEMDQVSDPSRNAHQQYWSLSPFCSPFATENKNKRRFLHRNRRGQHESNATASQTSENSNAKRLTEPLLPDLTSFRDEETGGELSGLLGEDLLLSSGENE